MGALEELTAQMEAIAGDWRLDAAARAAALRDIRERVSDALGHADRLIVLAQRSREAQAAAGIREGMAARRRADQHELALMEGADPKDLEEAAILSHRTLDELEEEGLLPEALERLQEQHPV